MDILVKILMIVFYVAVTCSCFCGVVLAIDMLRSSWNNKSRIKPK